MFSISVHVNLIKPYKTVDLCKTASNKQIYVHN